MPASHRSAEPALILPDTRSLQSVRAYSNPTLHWGRPTDLEAKGFLAILCQCCQSHFLDSKISNAGEEKDRLQSLWTFRAPDGKDFTGQWLFRGLPGSCSADTVWCLLAWWETPEIDPIKRETGPSQGCFVTKKTRRLWDHTEVGLNPDPPWQKALGKPLNCLEPKFFFLHMHVSQLWDAEKLGWILSCSTLSMFGRCWTTL